MIRDATKTLTVRRRASKEVDRRFYKIKLAIRDVVNRESGLIIVNRDFTFMRDPEKIAEFNRYLQDKINEEILFIEGGGAIEDHWLNVPISDGYIRGAKKSRLALERGLKGVSKIPDYSPLVNPIHADRAELIFTRAFEDLKGVTDVMATQISRELSNGILLGKNPKVVARAMEDRVDKIGKTRAKLIARTEIVESHNRASITEGSIISKETGVDIEYKWSTSIDGRERDTHHDRNGKVYGEDEVESLIGEPNCRCSVSPWFDINKIL